MKTQDQAMRRANGEDRLPKQTMRLSISAVCDIGCVKPNNEDMVLIQKEMFRDGERNAELQTGERLVIAVADGVGGLEKGEVASETVLAKLRGLLFNIPDDLSIEDLCEVFGVFATETNASMPRDMGSTLVGIFFYQNRLFRFHAGDSRLYLFRKGELSRLTVDHSLRESGGDPSAPSNIITNAIGGGESAFIEFAEVEGFFINDIFLLSSDGMHDLVSKNEIAAALKLPKAAKRLTAMAKKLGGKDNISVVTIKINEGERR